MTLYEIADDINGLFREYGLTHDVVEVVIRPADVAPYGTVRIGLDPRENEPDPMKWRPSMTTQIIEHDTLALRFCDDIDQDVMENLGFTFRELFRGYFEAVPKSDQLRLF